MSLDVGAADPTPRGGGLLDFQNRFGPSSKNLFKKGFYPGNG
jgi:hypothetical protein